MKQVLKATLVKDMAFYRQNYLELNAIPGRRKKMGFIKLPSNSEKILLELAQAENPTQALNAHGRYLFLLSLIFDTKKPGLQSLPGKEILAM